MGIVVVYTSNKTRMNICTYIYTCERTYILTHMHTYTCTSTYLVQYSHLLMTCLESCEICQNQSMAPRFDYSDSCICFEMCSSLVFFKLSDGLGEIDQGGE